MEFMPEHAPLVVITFLGTAALLALAAPVLLFAMWARKKWIAIGTAAFAFTLLSGYFLILTGVSLTSHEKLLAPGEWKYFCEIDCHVAYSVTGVEESAMQGDDLHPTAATGRLIMIHLKTWFDPSSISPHRGNGELSPGRRKVVLVDGHEREFPLSASAAQLVAKLHRASTPITQSLRPGESYVTDLVFDIPFDASNLRLFVGDGYELPDRVLIGHEDSYFHKKIYFALSARDSTSAGSVP